MKEPKSYGRTLNAGGGDGRKKPTVSGRVARRTKGGLLPWWVRKRLQEQTGTEGGVVDTKLYQAGRERKEPRLKNVQVGVQAACIALLTPFQIQHSLIWAHAKYKHEQ